MYRPTIKSDLWLGLMTIAFIVLVYWAETSRVKIRPANYPTKLEASQIMKGALDVLQNYRLPSVPRSNTGEAVNPLVFTMLGEKDSPITTDEGRIEDKITVLNPNFAAVVVDLMERTGVKHGDTVAVMLTGAMPGANLAVYSACRALGVTPIVITSVGSSWWGANIPDFTWLDMERVLNDDGVLMFKSVAASAGGSDDLGGLRLTEQGKQMIVDAAYRNNVLLLDEGSLSENISGRKRTYERFLPLNGYKAVINVGGGIAAIGHRENFKLLPTGRFQTLPVKNYPGRGMLHLFNEAGVPVVHISDVTELAQAYNLPIAKLPLPEIGKGVMFESDQYDLRTAAIALVMMFLILAVVKYFDRQRYRWREQTADADMEI